MMCRTSNLLQVQYTEYQEILCHHEVFPFEKILFLKNTSSHKWTESLYRTSLTYSHFFFFFYTLINIFGIISNHSQKWQSCVRKNSMITGKINLATIWTWAQPVTSGDKYLERYITRIICTWNEMFWVCLLP